MQTLAFVKAPPPQLYSVTVLDQMGTPAKVAKGRGPMFEPAHDISVLIGHSPMFLALPPQQDAAVWTWKVGEDFDLSAPGTYYVSMGGRIAHLDTTICSNTAEVVVRQ